MSFAEKLRAALLPAKNAEGKIPVAAWDEIVNATFAEEAKALKARKKKPTSQMTDEEWLKHLESEPSLAGVDIRRELGRAQFWCNENGRKCNRRFFVNWLGKADRSVSVKGAGQSSRPRIDPNLTVEPEGWYFVALNKWGVTAADGLKEKGWKAMDTYYRTEIIRVMI